MLDATDPETFRAVELLCHEARSGEKPLAIWVGAGASSWCGYPRWVELAGTAHKEFARYETTYDRSAGLALLSALDYPGLFQLCRDASSSRFYRLLSDSFSTRPVTPLYARFVAAIRAIAPSYLLTTNVDELLEQNLPVATVGWADIERSLVLLRRQESFVFKLHGSVSDLRSAVFTSSDYGAMSRNSNIQELLGRLLSLLSVVFIGYGLQDAHFLSTLRRNHELSVLFGDGPHFAILPSGEAALPKGIRVVRYFPEPHKDHRAAIQVIEEIGIARRQSTDEPEKVRAGEGRSLHVLSDVLPPGTWTTSQVLGVVGENGKALELVTGAGFTVDELPSHQSTAMHDLLVGLLCFDQVVAPVHTAARVHNLLNPERFWALVREGSLAFVAWKRQEFVIYPDSGAITQGDLGSGEIGNADRTTRTLQQVIRGQLAATPGQESLGEGLLSELEGKVREVTLEEEGCIPDLVRGLLLRPSVRQLLGISGGTAVNSLPRWHAFPILRLASVVRIGVTCRALGASSSKLDFGASALAGPAFAASWGIEWVDDVASYVLCDRFGTDVGRLAVADPRILDAVRTFRDTSAGTSLRREVLYRLAASEGAEVAAAVNGGLKASLPLRVLQEARDEFVGLYVSGAGSAALPAFWNDRRTADEAMGRWRDRSRRSLEEYCRQNHLKPYDPCPCGSGERLRFCCDEALQR